jgi:hypothetical protein
MMTVIVRQADTYLRGMDYDKRRLYPVDVSYYSGDGSFTLHGVSKMLVPRDANLPALEHMLALWSVRTNAEETKDRP